MNNNLKISGLNHNLSTPTVPDGACEKLHNLRYATSEWQGVCAFRKSHPITDTSYSIVYRHGALPPNHYITKQGATLSLCTLSDGEFTHVQTLTSVDPSLTYSVTSHGKALHITQPSHSDKTFIYDSANESYYRADMNSISCPVVTVSDPLIIRAEGTEITDPETTTVTLLTTIEREDREITERKDYYNTHLDNEITGEWAFFVAYRMFDGSVVKPSNVVYLSNAPEFIFEQHIDLSSASIHFYYAPLYAHRPTISISVPLTDDQKELISSVVVYSTRNNPPLNYDKLGDATLTNFKFIDADLSSDGATITVSKCYSGLDELRSDVNILETPFYEIDTLELDSTSLSFEFDYDKHFATIETCPVYESNFSALGREASHKLYYNSRLHEYDVLFTMAKPSVYMPKYLTRDNAVRLPTPSTSYTDATFVIEAEMSVDNTSYVTATEQPAYYHTINDEDCLLLPDVLSYPDARATRLRITLLTSDTHYLIIDKPLTADYSNNIAYCYLTAAEKTQSLPLSESCTPWAISDTFTTDDIIYISNQDNPFYFNPSTSLSINGEKILRLALAIDQLPDSTFGSNPLYVFTERGVHLAERGTGEVLYSNTTPFSQDLILDNTPTISLNGALIYLTASGVRLISQRDITTISTPLHDNHNKFLSSLPSFDFGFYYEPYNEIILQDNTSDYAYIYSLNNNCWSTRDMSSYNIISLRELADSKGVYDLSVTEDYAAPFSTTIKTRAITLDTFEKKRITTLIARCSSNNVELSIFGSADGTNWELARAGNTSRLRRTPQSYNYLMIEFFSFNQFLKFSFFDIEYFVRFVRHLK